MDHRLDAERAVDDIAGMPTTVCHGAGHEALRPTSAAADRILSRPKNIREVSLTITTKEVRHMPAP